MAAASPSHGKPAEASASMIAATSKDGDLASRNFMSSSPLAHGSALRAEAAAFLTANGAAILRMYPIFLTFPSGEYGTVVQNAENIVGRGTSHSVGPLQLY